MNLKGSSPEIEQAKAAVARAQKEYDEAESSSARKECLPLLLMRARDLEQSRRELEQLRTATEQLRAKELLLLQPHAAAGLQRAASEQEAEKLLHPLTDIPKSAAEVSTLLKQQRLPVNAQAAAILQSSRAHQKIVISNSYMAQILGVKLTNIASVNATGKNEELTAAIIIRLVLQVWATLQFYAAVQDRLSMNLDKNKRVAATAGSVHDPSAGNYRPNTIVIADHLLMLFGEEKRENLLDSAMADALLKFRDGLSPIFYGQIPYIPFFASSGNQIQFHILHTDGQTEACSPVYNVEIEDDRALCLLASINLHRLVKALLKLAPPHNMRALQGVEDWQPSLRVHTCIIRHKNQVHKLVYQLDSLLADFGHSFDSIQAAYAVAAGCPYMVQLASSGRNPSVHGPTKKERSDNAQVLQTERYLKVRMSRIGHLRDHRTLNSTEVCRVIHACLRTAAALHAANIVHRDFRHANVLWDKDGPFVIDLELAAVPPVKDPPSQVEWTQDTLSSGCYTCGSDVYQIGVMLERCMQTHGATLQDEEFASVLKSKVSAGIALQHAWLRCCRC